MSTADTEHDEWCRTSLHRARGAMDAAFALLVSGDAESVATADTMIRWSTEFRMLARHGEQPKPKAEGKARGTAKGKAKAGSYLDFLP